MFDLGDRINGGRRVQNLLDIVTLGSLFAHTCFFDYICVCGY